MNTSKQMIEFSTKAGTLKSLYPLLKSAKILPLITITFSEWNEIKANKSNLNLNELGQA